MESRLLPGAFWTGSDTPDDGMSHGARGRLQVRIWLQCALFQSLKRCKG